MGLNGYYNSMIRMASVNFRDGQFDAAQQLLDQAYRLSAENNGSMLEFSWKLLNDSNRYHFPSHHVSQFDLYLPPDYGIVLRKTYEKYTDRLKYNQILNLSVEFANRGAYFSSHLTRVNLDSDLFIKYRKENVNNLGSPAKSVGEFSSNHPLV